MTRLLLRIALIIGITSGLCLLVLLAWSTANAPHFASYYDVLLILNGVFALALFVWVIALTSRLLRQLRRKQFGARMTARFSLFFALIGVVPGVLIYTLSVQFLSRSIESWFNVRVDTALEAGLNLGRAALDSQLADLESRARGMAIEINHVSDDNLSLTLTRLRETNGVQEAMVFTGSGRVLAFSTNQYGQLMPSPPPAVILNQLRLARGYSAAEAVDSELSPQNQGLNLRVIVPLNTPSLFNGLLAGDSEPRWLQLLQPVPDQIASNANRVQQGFRDYQELSLSRIGLRKLYGITLTLALLLSVFSAIGVALYLSKRLVRPLLRLAAGTQAVGEGDYRPLPDATARDEVGQLTRSFNAMTQQLDDARRMVETNRQQLERTNVYLENVMANLSAGVLVFDESFRVTSVNKGAQNILQADLRSVIGRLLETADGMIEFAQIIRQSFVAHDAMGSERLHWQQQFEITVAQGDLLTLLARGTHMRVDGQGNGYLVVFDDITEVISANRTVAWGEVARRLAHEIKNPLTPIQLSAERLAMKLADRLSPDDARMLERSTRTIVDQVASLKHMVDDFREYARTPPAVFQFVDLNALICDVLALYGWDPDNESGRGTLRKFRLNVSLGEELPQIEGDPSQMRQVLHNLLSNARDAVEDHVAEPMIFVSTSLAYARLADGTELPAVKLSVADNGPGFSPHMIQRVFEPYVTTKTHGTGLGLAIVRKIVQEHGARIDLANRREGGARVSILFTRLVQAATAMDAQRQENDNAAK